MRILTLIVSFLFVAACQPVGDGSSDPLAGLDQRDGFLDLYVDQGQNKVFVRLPDAGDDGLILEAIHTARLTAGLGSNPVGLDRGWGDGGKHPRGPPPAPHTHPG